MELCDRYAMTICVWYFATSCRKVTGYWKRGNTDTGIEVKVRARNIRLQAKLRGVCARVLFLIMRLPEISCSGLKRWRNTNEAVSRQTPAGFLVNTGQTVRNILNRMMKGNGCYDE